MGRAPDLGGITVWEGYIPPIKIVIWGMVLKFFFHMQLLVVSLKIHGIFGFPRLPMAVPRLGQFLLRRGTFAPLLVSALRDRAVLSSPMVRYGKQLKILS